MEAGRLHGRGEGGAGPEWVGGALAHVCCEDEGRMYLILHTRGGPREAREREGGREGEIEQRKDLSETRCCIY